MLCAPAWKGEMARDISGGWTPLRCPQSPSQLKEKGDNPEGSFSIYMYYDHTQDKCFPFQFFGNGGNKNRFESEKSCMRNCSENAETFYPTDETKACHFNKTVGGCMSKYLRYYYDSVHDKCKTFFWTGCNGNGNRFLDAQACNNTCYGIHDDGDFDEEEELDTPVALILGLILSLIGVTIIVVFTLLAVKSRCEAPHEFCTLPPAEGTSADGSFNIYMYYDHTKDKCFPFQFFGNIGNENRFESEKFCMRNCSGNAEKFYPIEETKACHFNKTVGGCMSKYLRYYYDSVHDKCKTFFWTGCNGNGNRFLDAQACNNTCYGIHDDGDFEEEEEYDTPVALILGVVFGLIGGVILVAVIVLAVKQGKEKGEKRTKKEEVPMAGTNASA
ncbi:BPTI/Kunitz domain-containing protein [Sardina pilchardus]|uniref:BPTI/Kunitz domain-containing protein n=1 Tax=Sardina pilchardus TaxID=27697 RepID=UPI002E1181A0